MLRTVGFILKALSPLRTQPVRESEFLSHCGHNPLQGDEDEAKRSVCVFPSSAEEADLVPVFDRGL